VLERSAALRDRPIASVGIAVSLSMLVGKSPRCLCRFARGL
jgi:hypothetical protein